MNKKLDDLLSSNYDGIQEYDNDLPRWWQALFILTIVFSVVYVFVYHVSSNVSSEAELQQELGQLAAQNPKPAAPEFDSAALLALVKSPGRVTAGKATFQTNCAPCHGPEGQGVIGPNLTDNFWIHGGAITDIRRVVESGVPDKGMVPWKGLLGSAQMDEVTAYIFSIRGSNPANPKAPQGDPLPPA